MILLVVAVQVGIWFKELGSTDPDTRDTAMGKLVGEIETSDWDTRLELLKTIKQESQKTNDPEVSVRLQAILDNTIEAHLTKLVYQYRHWKHWEKRIDLRKILYNQIRDLYLEIETVIPWIHGNSSIVSEAKDLTKIQEYPCECHSSKLYWTMLHPMDDEDVSYIIEAYKVMWETRWKILNDQ